MLLQRLSLGWQLHGLGSYALSRLFLGVGLQLRNYVGCKM